MHANPNTIASLQCQENQQNCYIARLIVRLEVKRSPLGRAHPIIVVPSHLDGHTKKWRAHQKIFGRRCPSTFKLFLAPPPYALDCRFARTIC